MTTTLERRPRARPSHGRLPGWTVPVAVAVAVLARAPFLGRAPGPDEAGYLLVGGQWNGAGSSLYGDYWVDRPPLLVSIFRLADSLGGLTALRLVGCLAAALLVLGAARAARLIGGRRAAGWAAITAAALSLTPMLGVFAVNGELLAAPFVAGGIVAMLHAVQATARRHAVLEAALAGALGVCAVLVKQNFVDVAVFAGLLLLVAAARHEIDRRRLTDLAAGFAAGAVASMVLFVAWTAAHGTSLTGVFDAMYPFRIEAGRVIADAGRGHATARLLGLGWAAIASGLLLLALAVVPPLVHHRRTQAAAVWAMLGLGLFAAASVLLGGSYWHHYLIGLIVPMSILAGVVAGTGSRLVQSVVVFAAASTVLACGGYLLVDQGSAGQTVGTAIGAAAQPGDTIVSLYGHADIVQTSGLTSPYENLWSLPTKTRDPQLRELDTVLSGDRAPTWIVTGPSIRSWGLDTADARAIITRDYRPVTTLCDRTVYLQTGLVRSTPSAPSACEGTTTAIAQIKEHLLP